MTLSNLTLYLNLICLETLLPFFGRNYYIKIPDLDIDSSPNLPYILKLHRTKKVIYLTFNK